MISAESIKIIRAVLFGASVFWAVLYFFLYFKPFIEEITGTTKLNLDLWWWSGMAFSAVLGILTALLMLSL